MSSTSINLAFVIKAAANRFISAKLENAKSVKNNITNQQQNFNNIINLFDVFDMSNLINQVSLSKASESPAFYQYLDCSHINI